MRESYANRLKVPLAKSLMKPSSRVIDIGCGPGRVLLPVQEHCAGIVGIDSDPTVIEELQPKLRSSDSAVNAAAEKIPFSDDSFDVAICYSTLCVSNDPDMAISEIARVLRPNGRAVIDIRGTRNANHTFWKNYHAANGISLSGGTLTEARTQLRKHGLVIERTIGHGLTRAAYYLPVLRRWEWIERFTHSGSDPDLDYRLSNIMLLRELAASWYFVVRKPG
jgi:SAM-dependent methyltransferase